jgi:hypothetical protein
MQITRNSVETAPGPSDWFTGNVYIDPVAAPDRFMTHLAMQQVDDQGSAVTWGEHVSDEEYGAAPG